MSMEWLRTHKKKVFLVTAIVVVPSMSLFGVSGLTQDGNSSGYLPGGEYSTVTGKRVKVNGQDLHKLGVTLNQLKPPREDPQDESGLKRQERLIHRALDFKVHADLAGQLGMDFGPHELVERLRVEIRESTKQPQATDDVARRFYENYGIQPRDFAQITYDTAKIQRYAQMVREQAKWSATDLFLNYLKEKMQVRMLFKEFRAEDFEVKVEKPKAEALQEYYDQHKDLKSYDPNGLYTKAVLSAEALYISTKDLKAKMQPTEEELKQYYDRLKVIFWVKDKTQPAGKDNVKPYDEVKAEVREKYVEDSLYKTKDDLFKKLQDAFKEADKKAQLAGQDVDLAQLAAAHGMTYWRTKALKLEEFLKGDEKLSADNFKPATQLFSLGVPDTDPEKEKKKALIRNDIQTDRPFGKDDQAGHLALRLPKDGFNAARLMPLAEATPEIEKRLIHQSAEKLAKAEADKAFDQWSKGENVPQPEALQDEIFIHKKEDRDLSMLAQLYFFDPKPVGEVLPVATDRDKDQKVTYKVGFVVSVTLPTVENYDQDMAFNRDESRSMLYRAQAQFGGAEGMKYIKKISDSKIEKIIEPSGKAQ